MNLIFEPVSLEKGTIYLQRLSECANRASDYSFINLWGWAEEYGLQWAWEEDLVWIQQTIPEPSLWAPIGNWTSIDWSSRLGSVLDLPVVFSRVPESLLPLWEKALGSRMVVQETRGHWDYLYDYPALIELRGNRFHKKKNLLKQFQKKYAHQYVSLGSPTIDQALAMQTDWCTWRDCESHHTLAAENRAIEKILKNWEALAGLVGGAIVVEGQMVAYTVGERLTDDMLLIHFEKGNPEFKGIYQAINQLFLNHLQHPYQTANREQDLDDDGLRKAKLSYHPIDFIKKYQVTVT